MRIHVVALFFTSAVISASAFALDQCASPPNHHGNSRAPTRSAAHLICVAPEDAQLLAMILRRHYDASVACEEPSAFHVIQRSQCNALGGSLFGCDSTPSR